MIGKGQAASNKRLTLRRHSAATGIPQNRVRALPSARFCSTHIFAALVLLRKPSYGLQKRRQHSTDCPLVVTISP